MTTRRTTSDTFRGVVLAVALLLSLATSAVAESAAPAPARVLLEGTPYAAPVYVVESGEPGPTVVIVGGVHGNEPAGVAAAERIRRWPIASGRLIVIPRANVPGLEANKRRDPRVPADDGDLNRNFPHEDQSEPLGQPATAIWELIAASKPDWVLDLHEGYGFRAGGSKSVGNSLIYLASESLDPIAERMRSAVNATIDDPDQHFVLLQKSGGVKGGLTRAAREVLGAQSFTIETVYTDQPLGRRVRQHCLMVETVLREIGVLEQTIVAGATGE